MAENFQNPKPSDEGETIFKEYIETNFDDATLPGKFDKLTELYNEVNGVINISALRERSDVYIKHYLDSIYPHSYFKGECCDVGCGGGFPCIPLAIVTKLHFTGIDGVGKKLALINKCNAELGTNITAEHARSEDLVRAKRGFDTVCARAVADTDKVFGFCAPLVKSGGTLILYKTQNDLPAKAANLNRFGFILSETQDYTLPKTDIKRRLFIYDKN